MRVTHLGAAVALIETPDTRILTDPWYSPGIYDGSWYRWPPPTHEPPQADVVWVSHVHPDHYDPIFLASYLKWYPATRIVTGTGGPLPDVLRRDGFDPIVEDRVRVGDTELLTVAATSKSIENIDHALVVKRGSQSVANLNDCEGDEHLLRAVYGFAGYPTVLLAPFTGAGPFPQAYLMSAGDRCGFAAAKHRFWVQQFAMFLETLKPKFSFPFAGEYVLGGENWFLNAFRGNPEPWDVQGDNVFLGGTLDLDTGEAWGQQDVPPPFGAVEQYASMLADEPMAWHDETVFEPPLKLLEAAYEKAVSKVPTEEEHWLAVTCGDGWLVMNTARGNCYLTDDPQPEPRTEITVDERYLHGLCTKRFHWNNAEVGSNLRWWRSEHRYSWPLTVFLSHLHV